MTSFTTESRWLTRSITCPPFITSGRTEYRSLPPTVPLLFRAHLLVRKRMLIPQQRFGFNKPIRCCGNVPREPLSSKGCLSTGHSVTSGTCLPNRCLGMDVSEVLLWLHTSVFRRHVTICCRMRWRESHLRRIEYKKYIERKRSCDQNS
jgi:hypothetical protein